MDQIAAAMHALEGKDAGSSDGALEDDFVMAATTVRAHASTCICRGLSTHCSCCNYTRTHLSAQPDSIRVQQRATLIFLFLGTALTSY